VGRALRLWALRAGLDEFYDGSSTTDRELDGAQRSVDDATARPVDGAAGKIGEAIAGAVFAAVHVAR